MPTITLSSQNYSGQTAQITLLPSDDGSPIDIGIQTLPYIYTNTNVNGTYTLTFSNGLVCTVELPAT
jgi:hypothetical protein